MSVACRFLIGLALTAPAAAAELVPFSLPWDDGTPGPTDLSATLDKPAGGLGFIEARDGHLFAGGKRIRFFGATVPAGACFPDHDTADTMAARMAKFGLNAVRFHFLDSTWGKPRLIEYDTGDWTRWDADAQDRLDYFTNVHHTHLDTWDHIEPEDLKQAAAIVASFAYHAAMREERMPRKPLLDPK